MKTTKRIVAMVLVVASILFCLAGCKKNKTPTDTVYSLDQYTEDTSTDKKDFYYVAMSVDNYGVIILELDAKAAPKTVANFVKLVRSGFYNGLTFHRVIEGFMIQGGDPNADGTGGSSEKIEGEFLSNGYPNTIRHERGVISMARSNDMNSASSQFFICNATNSSVSGLDGKYAAFGRVLTGMEVVDAITGSTAQYGYDNNGTIANKSYQARIREMKVIIYGAADNNNVQVPTTDNNQTPTDNNQTPTDPLAKYTEDTSISKKDYYYVAMNIKDHGVIVLKLDATAAPETVANFVSLVRENFYDGLTFHRVISGFMIQGGDPKANGTGGSGTSITGEFLANGYPNTIRHEKGVISMARSNDMNSASSQFFICNATNSSVSSLDGKYAAFGHVIEGIEVVDSITSATAKYGDSNGTIANKSYQVVITEAKVIEYTEAN